MRPQGRRCGRGRCDSKDRAGSDALIEGVFPVLLVVGELVGNEIFRVVIRGEFGRQVECVWRCRRKTAAIRVGAVTKAAVEMAIGCLRAIVFSFTSWCAVGCPREKTWVQHRHWHRCETTVFLAGESDPRHRSPAPLDLASKHGESKWSDLARPIE